MAVYGVIAFAASQRRREIGLRMALGASYLPARRALRVDPSTALRSE